MGAVAPSWSLLCTFVASLLIDISSRFVNEVLDAMLHSHTRIAPTGKVHVLIADFVGKLICCTKTISIGTSHEKFMSWYRYTRERRVANDHDIVRSGSEDRLH